MRFLMIACLILCLSCKQGKKFHDEIEKQSYDTKTATMADILNFQKELNAEFKNPETSPLADKYRKNFEGLSFFPPDTSYVVKAKLIRKPDAVPFFMPTTTDRTSEEVVYGIAHFRLNGKEHQLEIYQNKELMQQAEYRDYLFLPFTDHTNGEETYMGGRYLDLSIPSGDTIVLNFNKAYNPYCTYNKKYSCPLVPSVNALNIKVMAGVMAFNPTNK